MTNYTYWRHSFAVPSEPTDYFTSTKTEFRPIIPTGWRTLQASDPSSKTETYKSGSITSILVLRQRNWHDRTVTVLPQSYVMIEPTVFDSANRPTVYSITVIPPQHSRYSNVTQKFSASVVKP